MDETVAYVPPDVIETLAVRNIGGLGKSDINPTGRNVLFWLHTFAASVSSMIPGGRWVTEQHLSIADQLRSGEDPSVYLPADTPDEVVREYDQHYNRYFNS